MISRRAVLGAGAMATAGAAFAQGAVPSSNAARFSMNYAPHEGLFASRGDRIEQIAFAADQGFTAWEDNEAAGRTVAEQEAMARAMRQRSLTMGVFVASMPKWAQSRPVFGQGRQDERDAFLADIRASLDVARRLEAKWMTIVPGFTDPRLPDEIQTARTIDTMRAAAEIVAPHGLVLVAEPLNTRRDHPGAFLRTIAQGYALARAVDSPGLKVLADVYHEQIQSGNLVPTLETCWNEVAYIQFGDNPGRNEPGSGEINYQTIVRTIRGRDYQGVIGMEHGISVTGRAGEERLLAAYRAIDRA